MKHLNNILIGMFLVVLLVFTTSCLDQTAEQTIETFSVSFNMPEEFGDTTSYANQKVTLKSLRNVYTATTDSSGRASFKNVIPGIYDIFSSQSLTGEVSLIADTLQYDLFKNDSLTLKLNKSIKVSLIISKIYASGTKDNNNKNYVKDKYFELFNNSDEVQYIDSTFYFGLVEADAKILFPAKQNPGYVYARQVFRFPVKDKPFAVQPGASVVITSSAVNHTEFAPISANLQNADFEAKNTTYSNNAAVPALDLIYSAFPTLIYVNLINGGDNGLFLFKTTENVKNFPLTDSEANQDYMRIPIEYVTDGVESLKYYSGGARPNTKRLQSFVDAGYSFISATNGYTHESIERRVDKVKSRSGRIYLIDTNNSFNDFRVVTDPTPRKYDKPLLVD